MIAAMAHDLFQLVRCGFEIDPAASAIITQHGQSVSYARLQQTVTAFSLKLLDGGVGPGDQVAVDIQNPAARLALVLAISRVGGVYVAGAGPAAVVSNGVSLDAVVTDRVRPPGGIKELLFDQTWSADNVSAAERDLPRYSDNTATAMILGSSGTTGMPKFMPFTLSMVAQRLDDKDHLHGSERLKRLVTVLPVAALGVELALQSLRSGGTLAWPVNSADETLQFVSEHQFEEIFTTPVLIGELAHAQANSGHDLSRLSRIYMAGSGISAARAKLARDALETRVFHLFGASETGSCTMIELTDDGPGPGVVGKPMPWLKVNILDETNQLVQAGESGRVSIAAGDERAVRAYLGHDDGSTLQDDWFFTGDLGFINKQGELVISGRVSEVINTGGNKIAPETIEALAETVAGVVAAGAVGIPNAEGFDDIGVAVITDDRFVEADLIRRLRHGLAGTMEIKLQKLASLPTNTGGKLDRSRLAKAITGNGA